MQRLKMSVKIDRVAFCCKPCHGRQAVTLGIAANVLKLWWSPKIHSSNLRYHYAHVTFKLAFNTIQWHLAII